MKVIYKTIIAVTVLTTLATGCGEKDSTENKIITKQESTKEPIKEESTQPLPVKKEKIDIDSKRPFIIDESLLKQYNELIKPEGKEYKNIDSIAIKGETLSLNLFIEAKSFNSMTEKLTESVSLAFAFDKLDDRNIKEITIIMYDNKGNYLHTANIKMDKVAKSLTSIGNGIDGVQKYQLYEAFSILPLIEQKFPEEYKVIQDLKNQQSDVEIHRNKGETDDIIKNSELFNIDKIANNSFRKSIKDKQLGLKNIDLVDNTVKANLSINTKGNYEEEIDKVIKSISTLYSFTDFEKNIKMIELTIYDTNNNKIDALSVDVKTFEQLLKDTQSTEDKTKLADKINSTLNLKNIINKFELKK